jgi:hypothetical protein
MKLVCVFVSIGLFLANATQAQPDTRFDGIWVGSETLEFMGTPGTRPAEIAIAKEGKLLRVVKGFYPARYLDVSWSGTTLVFQSADCRSELTLSPDGKTMKENGFATAAKVLRGSGVPIKTRLTGRFHRAK